MTKDEAMKLALEALEVCEQDGYIPVRSTRDAITALREALAEPDFWEGYVPEPVKPAQQEPVAWFEGEEIYWHNAPDLNDWIRQNGQPLYTSPPPCPTCKALARTVMMDQTGRDA